MGRNGLPIAHPCHEMETVDLDQLELLFLKWFKRWNLSSPHLGYSRLTLAASTTERRESSSRAIDVVTRTIWSNDWP
ncbi:hypothetical protein DL765_008588 [Monosporascus sp. GIB2]|nr:hypothetical protein DL765_008588 [Monosporascus sp. GIB2]